MKKLCYVVGTTLLVAACGTTTPAPPAAPAAPAAQPYSNLAQLMRGIPFPNSNLIFDAGNEDPEAKRKAKEKGAAGGSATSSYGNVYAGWQEVENAALALSETANLIMIPGRLCENGQPVPVGQDDYKKFAAGLAEAGKVAYKAAQSKNLDMMIEAGGTVTEACSACHEVYRDDKGDKNERRCIPTPAK